MSFNNEKDLIKVLGWTKTSKLLYIIKELDSGKSKDEILEGLEGLIKPKSFYSYLNQIERIRSDISFV
tara:strand:- start:178 stop:381 length:204 start_codon:yes stop_codon:yes gene_type:complete